MASQKDTILGELAIERGYLTPEQVDEAKELQRKLKEEMSIEQSLARILLGKKWLNEDRASELRKAVAVETGEVRMVGGYEIVARLGRGGMGAVYKARRSGASDPSEGPQSGEYVALKILPPSLASEDLVARFRREAEITRGLSSDNIVGCVEFGFDKKRKCHFCALEFVKGEDLGKRIKRKGKLPEAEATRITMQMAMALQHAHHNGLVHRDVKPANIMVTLDRKAMLLDLGLARPTSEKDVRLTQSGAFVGSAYYASPEQASGRGDVDIRSDIYSLGATVYHVVTGSPPFEGETVLAVLQKQVSGTVPWPAEITPGLSEGFCRVIAKMMAKDPDDRYQTPNDIHRDLDLIAAGEEPEVSEKALRNSSVKLPTVPRSRRIRRALERAERSRGRRARSDGRREKPDSRRERARRPARDRSDSRRQKRESARARRREKEAEASPGPVPAPEPQPRPEAKPGPGPDAEPGPEPEAKPQAEAEPERKHRTGTGPGRGGPPAKGPWTSRRRKALAAAGVLALLAGVGTAIFLVAGKRVPVEDRHLEVNWGATPPKGTILREWWQPPVGEDSAVLDRSAPPPPTGSELVKSFDGAKNWKDNYNSRIRGYVHAPVSGKYVFRLCSDDDSELWLSRNDNPARAVKIAQIDAHTGHDTWDAASRPVKLKAGRRYYVEAVHREGTGEDHIRVGWDRPDGAKQWPIPGRFLSPGRDIPRPPTITSTAPEIGGAGVLYRYEIKVVAAPAARITVEGLPPWLKFDGRSTVSGTPGKEHAGTASEVTVAAANRLGSDTQVFTVKIIDADPTLVGWWTFDDDKKASDSSPWGNDGEFLDNAWTDPKTGRIGGGLLVDGQDDSMKVPDSPSISATRALTIAAWMKHRDGRWQGEGTIASKIDSYWFYVGEGGKALFVSLRGRKGKVTAKMPCALDGQKWYHVAVAVDTKARDARFYVNGSWVGTAGTAGVSAIRKTAGALHVGAANRRDREFKGCLDDVRIYTRALPAEEIWTLYRQGFDRAPPKITSAPPQVALGGVAYAYGIRTDGRPAPEISVKNLPEWLEFDGRQMIAGTPGAALAGTTTDTITVTAKNELGEQAQEFRIGVEKAVSGLVGWWTFDEGAGALDSSGRGNHGGLANDARAVPGLGRIGGGLGLDGHYDAVRVPDSPSVSVTGPLTIAAWLNHSGDKWPADRTIVAKRGAYWFWIGEGGKALLLRLRDQRDNPAAKVPYEFESGKWYHVAVAADPEMGDALFYVDGSWVGTAGTTVRRIRDNREELFIGSRSVHDREFKGALDDVRVYSRALDGKEVRALYHAGSGRRPSSIAGAAPEPASPGVRYVHRIGAVGNPAPKVTVENLPTWLKFDGKDAILGTPGEGVAAGATDTITVTASNGVGPDAKTSFRVGIRGRDLLRGLVGRWTFDEDTGARDWSGKDSHGRLFQGARVEPGRGKTGGGLRLDGHYDAVKVRDSPPLSVTGSLTLAAWVRDSDGKWQADRTVVSKVDSYWLWVGENGKALFLRLWDRRTYATLQGACAFKGAAWHHVAAAVDFDTAAVRFYVNGSPAGRAAIPGNVRRIRDTTSELFIGSRTVHDREFKGHLDDVRVYNRALSAADVRALYHEGSGPVPPRIVSKSPRAASLGLRYRYRIEAAGSPPPRITVTGLPPWLKFDGRDTISGAPEERHVGSAPKATVSAANHLGTDTQELNIKVQKTDPALVGWWRLDDGEGERAEDSSPRGNHGKIARASAAARAGGAKWVEGRIGGALEFDGKGFIDIGSGVTELGRAEWTVAAWVKTVGRGVAILSKSNNDGSWNRHEKQFYISRSDDHNQKPAGSAVFAGRDCKWISGSAVVSDGEWHHVAWTWNPKSATGGVHVDGAVGVTLADYNGGADNAGDKIRIGFDTSGEAVTNLRGVIDDVRIYSRALSADEVKALHDAAFGPRPPEITIEAPSVASVGAPYSCKVSALGNPAPRVRVESSPRWLGFDGKRVLAGTPGAGDAGSAEITVVATNEHGTKRQTFKIEVRKADAGLAGWWKLDDARGTTARDSSGGGRHGGLVGGAGWGEGKVGGAVKFGGRTSRVMTSLRIDQKEGTAGATFAAWVRPASADRGEHCVVSTDNGGSDWSLLQYRGMWNARTGTEHRASGFPVEVGAWQHVAAVFDPAAGNVRLYKNGAETVVREIGYDTSTGNVTIGARASDGGSSFGGLIDDVRVYGRALSAAEVLTVYSAGTRRAPSSITSVAPTVAFAATPYAYSVDAAGNPPPKITVAKLPPWLAFDGESTISGAPGVGHVDSINTVTVAATNELGIDRQTFTIKVAKQDPRFVGWWTFDDMRGATARDWSGRARHGGLVGGASWVASKIGSAVDFDGRSNRVMTSLRIDQKEGTAGATFAAWVRPAGADRSERCVVSTDNGGSDWSLLQCRGAWDVRTGTERRATGFPVEVGAWQHVAAVFDPAAGNVRFYKNGAEAVIRELGYDTSTGNVTIGASAPKGGSCFGGLIDDVRVCDRALSAGEVWAIYSAGARRAPSAIVSVPPAVAFSGTPYAYSVAAAGNPRPNIEVKGLPSWLKFDGRHTILGTPAARLMGSTRAITVTATNESGADKQVFRIRIAKSDPSLVGWWRLDEMQGTTARDSSRGARHGELTGSAKWLEGKVGGALRAGGRSACVTTPLNVDQSKGSRGVTLTAWVNPASAGRSERYVLSTDDGGSDWSLLRGGREWQVTSGEERRGTGFPVSVGRWQHVAAVFDPAAGSVRFYKNGAEAVIRELGYDKSTGNVTIGARTPEGGNCFEGAIDEVRVYRRALSADEVWVFYEVGAAARQ